MSDFVIQVEQKTTYEFVVHAPDEDTARAKVHAFMAGEAIRGIERTGGPDYGEVHTFVVGERTEVHPVHTTL